jgi:hypothetical protein
VRSAFGLAAALLVAAQLAGPNANERRAAAQPPMSSWLLGNQALLVDYLWFDLLQYFGAYRLGEHGLEEFTTRADRLFELDGDFPSAVIFTCVVRATDLQDPRGALQWLRQAETRHPTEWYYPYEQGFINYLWLQDYAQAELDFRRAGRCPGAPSAWHHFVARIHELGGDLSLARDLWLEIAAATEHADLRERAIRNAERLTALLESQGKSGT